MRKLPVGTLAATALMLGSFVIAPLSAEARTPKVNGSASWSYYETPEKGSNTWVHVGAYGKSVKCSEIDKSDPLITSELPAIKASCQAKVTSNYSSSGKSKTRYHAARVPAGMKFVSGMYVYASLDGMSEHKYYRWNGKKLKMQRTIDGETTSLKFVSFNFYNHAGALITEPPAPLSIGEPIYTPQLPVEPGCLPEEPCKGGDPQPPINNYPTGDCNYQESNKGGPCDYDLPREK